MRPCLLSLLLLCGCATVQSPGTFSRPDRPRPLIDGRAVAVAAVRCDAPNLVEGEVPQTVAWLDASVSTRVSSHRVELEPTGQQRVCEALASDRALYRDAVFGTEWQVPAGIATLVQQVAATSRAEHVWV